MVTSGISCTLRLLGSPVKSQRWRNRISLFNWVVCPTIALRESLLCGKMESSDRITQSTSRRPRCVALKVWKRRVHRRETFTSANLRNESHGLPNSRKRTQDETLRQEWCARRDAWELEKDSGTQRRSQKIRSTLLPNLG